MIRMVSLIFIVMTLVACRPADAEPQEQDCAGFAGGNAVVDDCGVCGGDGSSCADCAGVPNGDDLSCVDCAGVLNGDAVEDACGVCGGDDSSCLDCSGVPNGEDLSCADCAGVPNGEAVLDACGVCDGDGPLDNDPSLCGFVQIEDGGFTMGSPEGELGRFDNEVQHQVTLTRSFYMMAHEVTKTEWVAVMRQEPFGDSVMCDNCPIRFRTWWDALHYANALSEAQGLRPCYVMSGCEDVNFDSSKVCTDVTLQDAAGDNVTTPYECEGYRLPTEAEWEYAIRAGTTTAFYNGDITVPEGSDPNANDIAWYGQNSGYTTHAVKGKTPNAWGLYDMSGNVWEWTWDWYGSYSGDATDPAGPSSGSYRVLRGGSWNFSAGFVRVANRTYYTPGTRGDSVGFRLARSP